MSSNVAPIKASVSCEPLKKLIREVPDFPKKGILFYDITTVLKDKLGFAMLIDALSEHYHGAEDRFSSWGWRLVDLSLLRHWLTG